MRVVICQIGYVRLAVDLLLVLLQATGLLDYRVKNEGESQWEGEVRDPVANAPDRYCTLLIINIMVCASGGEEKGR